MKHGQLLDTALTSALASCHAEVNACWQVITTFLRFGFKINRHEYAILLLEGISKVFRDTQEVQNLQQAATTASLMGQKDVSYLAEGTSSFEQEMGSLVSIKEMKVPVYTQWALIGHKL